MRARAALVGTGDLRLHPCVDHLGGELPGLGAVVGDGGPVGVVRREGEDVGGLARGLPGEGEVGASVRLDGPAPERDDRGVGAVDGPPRRVGHAVDAEAFGDVDVDGDDSLRLGGHADGDVADRARLHDDRRRAHMGARRPDGHSE